MAKRALSDLLVPGAFFLVAGAGLVEFLLDDDWTRWLGVMMAVTGLVVGVALLRRGSPTTGAKTPVAAPPPKHPPPSDSPTVRTGGIRVTDLPPGLRRTDDHGTQPKPPPNPE
ncbi:MAG TPA: hypothetical protein VGA22_05800 [Gemmatimonadales bacterium]|jgi:hypothetical protein